MVFSADTLFKGGPGATGRSFSSFPTIIESIRTKLLPLPPATVVHTGHGDDTRIGDEAPTSRSGSPGVTSRVRTTPLQNSFAKVVCSP